MGTPGASKGLTWRRTRASRARCGGAGKYQGAAYALLMPTLQMSILCKHASRPQSACPITAGLQGALTSEAAHLVEGEGAGLALLRVRDGRGICKLIDHLRLAGSARRCRAGGRGVISCLQGGTSSAALAHARPASTIQPRPKEIRSAVQRRRVSPALRCIAQSARAHLFVEDGHSQVQQAHHHHQAHAHRGPQLRGWERVGGAVAAGASAKSAAAAGRAWYSCSDGLADRAEGVHGRGGRCRQAAGKWF